MAVGSRYLVLTQVMDDGRLVRASDPDPTVVLTPTQAPALIALGAVSPIPVGADQVNESVTAGDLTSIVYDSAGYVLSYVQGGVPCSIDRDAEGRVITITVGDLTSIVLYDAAGRVAGVTTQ